MTDPAGKRPRAIENLRENHGEIMAMLSGGQRQQQQQRQQHSGWGEPDLPPHRAERGLQVQR